MSDNRKDDDDNNGKLLSFPGGKKVDPTDIGVGAFIIGPAGHVPTPELQDPTDIDRDVRNRTHYVNNQELVKVVEQKGSTSELMDVLLKEIAEETAHLKYERDKAIKDGKSSANFNI